MPTRHPNLADLTDVLPAFRACWAYGLFTTNPLTFGRLGGWAGMQSCNSALCLEAKAPAKQCGLMAGPSSLSATSVTIVSCPPWPLARLAASSLQQLSSLLADDHRNFLGALRLRWASLGLVRAPAHAGAAITLASSPPLRP